MRNMMLVLACLLVPLYVGAQKVVDGGGTASPPSIPVADQKAFSDLGDGTFIWESPLPDKAGTEIACVEKDAAGKYRVKVLIDNSHSVQFKFATVPTVAQVTAARQSVIAAEDAAKAAATAAAAKAAEAEQLKAEGKCPTCGQPLPK